MLHERLNADMIDIHSHTKFSADGRDTAQDMAAAAFTAGCKIFGFSEHVDMDYYVSGLDFVQTDLDAYLSCAHALKVEYAGRGVTLLAGAEFGYHSDAQDEYVRLTNKYSFDYCINSVHLTDGKDCYLQPYFEGKDKQFAYRRYLETVLESLNVKYDYHIVGHLGYVARNAPYPDQLLRYSDFPALIDKILDTVIKEQKVLEVNTNVKTAGTPVMPSYEILARYYELGGRLISYGSDAHNVGRILEGFGQVSANLKKIGFENLSYFEKGNAKFIKL